MNSEQQTEIEAAVFRRFVEHLQQHPEAQNIDLMVLADFCRNCLAKWYMSAANDRNEEITYSQARELIYGMPYEEWKSNHQPEATPAQQQAYEEALKRREAAKQQ